jgi:rod shape-determining protein MreD
MRKNKSKKLPKTDAVLTFFRIVAYIEIALVCQVISSVGTGVKPLILIPFAICLSTWSDEVSSAFAGMLCGFLIDMSCSRLLGFNAIILIILCTATSLLYTRLLRRKFINFFILSTLACIIQGLVDYFFTYAIWNHENSSYVLTNITYKSIIATVISSVFVYFIVNLINKKMKPYEIKTVEEAMQYEYDE